MQLLASRPGKVLAGLLLLALVTLGVLAAFGLLQGQAWKYLQAILIALALTIAIWVAIDQAVKRWQRRRQASFDAQIAAKEGIQDRKAEWARWTADLARQRVDRYSLPFYLLVGEPQSGKSILLKNSDLHFPMGQEKLSGPGGTRGCDWWFTEEAVILDLAGRLFTHEGGASDEAEWGAFLELLAGFRPQCPANGVLFVLPCDGLLNDGESQVTKKAARMQAALLTLTEKLQARLPVYVVLTKADMIFGFAECVHRLEGEKRQEMFGWSRPTEKVDAPFELAETHKGFRGLTGRARLLRAQMLSTARLPEALAEVDRLYAFPEELEALWPNLALYLQRIFGESQLVEKLFFRGFYLTSGLQSGAPIAKVCAELLGGAGEADRRNLEALFQKSRAFFIKDLVKRRVFSEKGLVRPTRQRVLAARRRAWVGYGAAGVLALLSLGATVMYLARKQDQAEIEEYRAALDATETVEEGSASLEPALEALSKVQHAIEHEVRGYEHFFESARDGFEDLYVAIFDRRLMPAVRALAQEGVLAAGDPEGELGFEKQLTDVELLLGEVEREEGYAKLLRLADSPAEGLEAALARRRSLRALASSGPTAAARDALRTRASELWDGVLRAGSGWQVGSLLGYVLAREGLMRAHAGLEALQGDVHEHCRTLVRSLEVIDACLQDLQEKDGKRRLERKKVLAQLTELSDGRARSLSDPWKAMERVQDSIDEMFSGESSTLVPDKVVAKISADKRLARACDPGFLAPELDPTALPDQLRECFELMTGDMAGKVAAAKGLLACTRYRERFQTWKDLGSSVAAGSEGSYSDDLSSHLAALWKALDSLDKKDTRFQPEQVHAERLLGGYEAEMQEEWKGVDLARNARELARHVQALKDVGGPHPAWKDQADDELAARILERGEELDRHWSTSSAGSESDFRKAVAAFLAALTDLKDKLNAQPTLGEDLQVLPLEELPKSEVAKSKVLSLRLSEPDLDAKGLAAWKAFAARLQQGTQQGSTSTKGFATLLASEVPEAMTGGLGKYLMSHWTPLEPLAVKELGKRFLEDAKALLGPYAPYGRVVKALWGEEVEAASLPDLVSEVFDRDGKLDELMRSVLLDKNAEGNGALAKWTLENLFPPTNKATPGFFGFMGEVQAFLLQGKGTVAETEISFTLTPSWGSGTIWQEKKSDWFSCRAFGMSCGPVEIGTKMSPCTLKWRFVGDQDALEMRWSREVSDWSGKAEGDVTWKKDWLFTPLLLAWDGTDLRKLDFPVDGAKFKATFDLSLPSGLPKRPPRKPW